jgi:hypothetical protein
MIEIRAHCPICDHPLRIPVQRSLVLRPVEHTCLECNGVVTVAIIGAGEDMHVRVQPQTVPPKGA